jgi:hypothetical protein
LGGRGARRRDGADWTCLVRGYLLYCCGACSRRSLRCHTGAFIHLERFEGLSCARKSLLRLRRFALGSASKERPCSAWPGRLSRCTGFCISLLHAFAYCLLNILCAYAMPEVGAPTHCFWELGRPGKRLTLSLRLVPQPIASGNWAGPARDSH